MALNNLSQHLFFLFASSVSSMQISRLQKAEGGYSDLVCQYSYSSQDKIGQQLLHFYYSYIHLDLPSTGGSQIKLRRVSAI